MIFVSHFCPSCSSRSLTTLYRCMHYRKYTIHPVASASTLIPTVSSSATPSRPLAETGSSCSSCSSLANLWRYSRAMPNIVCRCLLRAGWTCPERVCPGITFVSDQTPSQTASEELTCTVSMLNSPSVLSSFPSMQSLRASMWKSDSRWFSFRYRFVANSDNVGLPWLARSLIPSQTARRFSHAVQSETRPRQSIVGVRSTLMLV